MKVLFSRNGLFSRFHFPPVTKTLRHIDLLLGNDHETNETTAIAMQQLCKYITVFEPLLGSGLRPTMQILLEAMFSM
jgi:hypothetical protein